MNQFTPDHSPGATPLDPSELEGLIPDYITTQGELNALERENILDASISAHGRKHADILNAAFAFDLHKRMFQRVWKWAGTRRTTNKNIGVSKEEIYTELAKLFGDVKYWIDNETYSLDEIAARFHHKLVSIHPFVNGNGRHARLMTEILLTSLNREPFTWGMKSSPDALDAEGPLRDQYVSSLKQADAGDYTALLAFVRS